MRPVIGVSCYGERARWGAWDVDAVVLHRAYVTALESSGAAVVLVPPLHDESSIDAILEKLDGLVLAGGADLEPASYGAEPHAEHRRAAPGPRRHGTAALPRCARARAAPARASAAAFR